jgi:oligosaccharyltransferase complex subunit beta
LTPQTLVELLKKKINLIVALSPTLTPLHSFAAEFGLTLPPPETPLMSHFPVRKSALTTLEIPVKPDSKIITPGTEPILFSGINFALSSNPMLFPIISAPPESFASDTTKEDEAEILSQSAEKGGEGLWAGSSMGVVAGFQTKSGGRVVWTGGVEMFGDNFAAQTTQGAKVGNEVVAHDLAKWAFQESNMLRIEKVEHHRVGETEPRETYTNNDNVVSYHYEPWISFSVFNMFLNYYRHTGVYIDGVALQPIQVQVGTILWHRRYAIRIYHARPSHPHFP